MARHKGKPNPNTPPIALKRTYDPESLATVVADNVAAGKALRVNPNMGPVTDTDRMTIARITGEPVEAFNERLAMKLRDIADLATQRIREKLEGDQFKPGELGFILSVAHDKRLSLDGSRALNNASVNLTVNNFGADARAKMLAELAALSGAKRVKPENVVEAEVVDAKKPGG